MIRIRDTWKDTKGNSWDTQLFSKEEAAKAAAFLAKAIRYWELNQESMEFNPYCMMHNMSIEGAISSYRKERDEYLFCIFHK
ncbi:hypothetical protein [Helicobacter labetoulli]|uniref:hypothetical protein n=1 Tax=Helicobacter labetoulli TaxID=2315333 RepID=UPI000EF65E1D|nr:hypothetical protein [Helicobacter labetoulli]